MFSSKYLTIVAKIRDVVVTRGDQAVIGDEVTQVWAYRR